MKKVQKGEYGYIHSQKICRSFITFILLLIPVVIFFIGLAIYHKRENMFTFVAIMGCLPGCRYAVGMIMMLLQKETDPAVYEKTRKAVESFPPSMTACLRPMRRRLPWTLWCWAREALSAIHPTRRPTRNTSRSI